ncbi:MAG: ATP-dependent RNA helicase DHH1 [Amphiamblys sp. WSBS2006]|nr:MAG: ATP-dependent RNA helicase DHH1 [Amphiamblys sp. WSBS2006]
MDTSLTNKTNLSRNEARPGEGRAQTKDVTATSDGTFHDYGLNKQILLSLAEMGYEYPSPIQAESIPAVFAGQDVIARAKNGTGKTAAFAIPILSRIDTAAKHIQAVILTPTRELALQTGHVCRKICAKIPELKVVVTTGGTDLKDDIFRLTHHPQVVVATPGRLCDLAKKVVNLAKCRQIVLDEADKLLSDFFAPSITSLFEAVPAACQKLLYSATFPAFVKGFIQREMPTAKQLNTMNELTLHGITQYYVYVEEDQKISCLNTLFAGLKINQAIIFCNSTKRVEFLARQITRLGYSCFYTHAKIPQTERNKVFHDFRAGKFRTLVCSDLFTRGIDVQAVNVVINFDFPYRTDTYLHRIGRSGRFGQLGLAISMVTDREIDVFRQVSRETDSVIDPIPPAIDTGLYT